MVIVELLTRLAPVVVVAGAIGAMLLWGCWFQPREVARKRRAELLAAFLVILEDELYRTLKKGAEGSSHTYRTFVLGVTPCQATILYRMFEELGGMKALSPEKALWWKRTLERLVSKLGFYMDDVPRFPGYSRHPIAFTRIPRHSGSGGKGSY